jgi:hypothetical protein
MEKESKRLKDSEKMGEYYEKLVLGVKGFGGKFLESKNKEYVLFRPSTSGQVLALIKNNKVLWRKEFDNLVSFDLAKDGSFIVIVAQLTKSEMPSGYKSGGHLYLVTKEGETNDIKIGCDGLSCSISPNCKNFGITTMGPEWGVYYYNNQGQLLWKKKFDKRVGGIKLLKNKIILYNKMHEETRKEVIRLNSKGNE